MNFKGVFLLNIQLLLFSLSTLAMNADSTIRPLNFPDTWNKAISDTTILDFHSYHPATYFGMPGIGTGNIGSSKYQLEPDPTSLSRKEFSLLNPYYHVLHKADELEKFSSTSRFTRLYYQTGSGKQQYLRVNHSQYLSPGIQAALSFDRISSEGKYPRQLNRIGDLGAGLRGGTNSGQYRFFANYKIQHLENQENGGAQPVAAPLGDPQLQSVFLSSAKNDLRNYSLYFYHELNLGDAISVDSLRQIHPYRFYSKHAYNRGRTLYSDDQPLSGFYQFSWLDTTATRDVYRLHDLKNEVGFDLGLKINSAAYKAGLALASRSDRHIFEGVDTLFNDLGVLIKVSSISAGKLNFGINSYNVINGQAIGDRKFDLHGNYNAGKGNSFDLRFTNFELQTNLFLNKFTSNHFIWSNELPEIKGNLIAGSFKSDSLGLRLNLNFQSIKNYPFITSYLNPRSFSGTTNITSIEISKEFNAGYWKFQTRARVNQINDNTAIELPDYVLFQRFQYNNKLFKHALGFSAGIDLSYIPAFYGDSWMPATRSYYRQNTQLTGDHIFINPFVNLKISNARIFVMLEDAAGDAINGDAMIVPGYPLQGRSLRFGINWDFFD